MTAVGHAVLRFTNRRGEPAVAVGAPRTLAQRLPRLRGEASLDAGGVEVGGVRRGENRRGRPCWVWWVDETVTGPVKGV